MGSAFLNLVNEADFRRDTDWRLSSYGAGDTILEAGQTGSALHVIQVGTVRVLGDVELEGERRIRPGFFDLSEGEIFGELSLFDQRPRSASVMAVSDCDIASIDGMRLKEYMDRNPETGYRLLWELSTILGARLRRTNDKLFSVMAWGLKARGIEQHL